MNAHEDMRGEAVRARAAEVAQRFGLRMLVLYGSRARGRDPAPAPDSDVDVAVLGCLRERFFDCLDAVAGIFPQLEVDLARFEDADPLFRYEIMRDAVLLAGDEDLFCEYRAYAFRDFVDSADLRALEEALHRKRMKRIAEALDAPA